MQVVNHPMIYRTMKFILENPGQLILINCSAGFHRAPCVAALLFYILMVSWQIESSSLSCWQLSSQALGVEVVVVNVGVSCHWGQDVAILYQFLQGEVSSFLDTQVCLCLLALRHCRCAKENCYGADLREQLVHQVL